SLHLKDVSAETALRLTAEQAGLKTVMVGEVVYVTSEANAAKMQAEQDRKLANTAKAMGLGGLGALGLGGGAPGLAAGGLGALGGGGGALGIGGGMLGFSGG